MPKLLQVLLCLLLPVLLLIALLVVIIPQSLKSLSFAYAFFRNSDCNKGEVKLVELRQFCKRWLSNKQEERNYQNDIFEHAGGYCSASRLACPLLDCPSVKTTVK